MDKSPINAKTAKKLRESMNLTQAELGKLLDVSVHTIRAWESGKRLCSGPAGRLMALIRHDPDSILPALCRVAPGFTWADLNTR